MKDKKVSIVMPTYNRAYVLWKAILSIQSQTHSNWELVVVDDRSTDDTEKLMREFRADHRIKYVKNQFAHSPAGARKQGYQLASGDYIAYLDSDNTAYSTWLESSLEKFSSNKEIKFLYPALNFRLLHLVDGEFRTYKEESTKSPYPTIADLWSHEFEGDPNGLIHIAEATKLIEGWDESLTLYEDYDYSLQLAKVYPEGFSYLPLVLINYTRLYGEMGICNDATYESIVTNLKRLDDKYKDYSEWTNRNWHSDLIKKYQEYDKQGVKPIDRIVSKYDKN